MLTLIALFGVGSLRSLADHRSPWWAAGLEMLGLGAVVAVAADASGALVDRSWIDQRLAYAAAAFAANSGPDRQDGAGRVANQGLRRRPEEHPIDRIPAVDAEHDQIASLFAGDAEKLVMRFPRRHDSLRRARSSGSRSRPPRATAHGRPLPPPSGNRRDPSGARSAGRTRRASIRPR